MLADKKRKGILFARVEDRSFAAYKEFITDVVGGLTGGRALSLSDEYLRKAWKAFWAKGGEEDEK